MKKMFSMMLVVAMVCMLSVTAFAAGSAGALEPGAVVGATSPSTGAAGAVVLAAVVGTASMLGMGVSKKNK